MPWNGSGQFNRDTGVFQGATVWDDSRLAARTVRSDDHDTHDEDIATGLENTVTRDGQNQPSANLPMATFRHTGVGNAAARTDYAAAGQIQDQGLTHIAPASVGGTGDAITLSPTPAITAYVAGQRFSFVAELTNTVAVTVAVSGLVVKAIQKLGAALVAGDITTGDLVEIEYDGTQFQMLTPARTPVFTAGAIATAALADDLVTLAKMAPGTDGNLITYDASGDPAAVATGTSGQVLTSNGAGAAPTMQDSIVLSTEQASTSGSNIDFTGLPAGIKRITVMLEGVSNAGGTNLSIQLGDSGGFETTGYAGRVSDEGGAGTDHSTSFLLTNGFSSAQTFYCVAILVRMNNAHKWMLTATGATQTVAVQEGTYSTGRKTLSGELTQIRIAGGSTFDAGNINILHE